MYSERGKRPLPELRPYPGQADAALRLVHLRRRRSATLAASAAGLVVVASLLVSARGSGLAVVEPADPLPAPSVAPSAAPAPVAPSRPSASPSPDPAPFVPVSPTALVEVPRPTMSPTTPAPDSSGRPPAMRQGREPVRRGLMRKPTHCAPIGAWCTTIIKTAKDDVPWFQLLACHPAGTEPASLRFEEDREVDVAIVSRQTGEEVWRWSSTEPAPSPNEHTITAEAGWCFVWTVIWNGLADDGKPLPPGEYTLLGEVLSTPPMFDDTNWVEQ